MALRCYDGLQSRAETPLWLGPVIASAGMPASLARGVTLTNYKTTTQKGGEVGFGWYTGVYGMEVMCSFLFFIVKQKQSSRSEHAHAYHDEDTETLTLAHTQAGTHAHTHAHTHTYTHTHTKTWYFHS